MFALIKNRICCYHKHGSLDDVFRFIGVSLINRKNFLDFSDSLRCTPLSSCFVRRLCHLYLFFFFCRRKFTIWLIGRSFLRFMGSVEFLSRGLVKVDVANEFITLWASYLERISCTDIYRSTWMDFNCNISFLITSFEKLNGI